MGGDIGKENWLNKDIEEQGTGQDNSDLFFCGYYLWPSSTQPIY